MIPVCCVVTDKTLAEFELLKFSLEQYHDVEWYISCDAVVESYYRDTAEVNQIKLVESDDCDHNIQSQEKNNNFMKVVMTKFKICREALKKHDHCLLLDSDMVFVNPIEDRVLELMRDRSVDAIISPHMTNSVSIESKHGYYNCGMVAIMDEDFLNSWEELSSNYKKFNMYYEQQPLEFIHRSFLTSNFPIHYNLGWWRFNLPHTQDRIKMFNEKDSKLYFANNEAVNFHFHALRELETENYGKFMVNFVFDYLSHSNNKKYSDLYKKYEELRLEKNID